MRSSCFTMGALLLLGVAVGQSQDAVPVPAVDGFVTHVESATNFEINGRQIIVKADSRVSFQTSSGTAVPNADQARPFLGEGAKAYGKYDRKNHTVMASAVELVDTRSRDVGGSGVIDAILPVPSSSAAGDRLVRADGYPVLLSSKTTMTYTQPISVGTPLTSNLWLKFHGKQDRDGTVIAESATLSENVVTSGEDKLRSKHEYDPSAVDPDAHQSAVSRAFLGLDPEKIPPTKDAAMQSRVDQIGQRLVPKYQRDLPDSDDRKIRFRFQVVDGKKWPDALTWPNGIILVPHPLVERLQDDAQLAVVLADNIAAALEKQTLHAQPPSRALTVANIAGGVGGAFIPGLGLATQVATGTTAYKLEVLRQEQSGRVSLGLLRDAGFDIQKAPLAWWILASKKGKDLAETNVPRRALYLYKTLGTTWRQSP